MADETLQKALDKLGFDPRKGGFTEAAVKEAIEEVTKERGDLKKEEVKKVIGEVIALVEQADQIEKQFHGANKKINKGLRKLLNRLEGRPDPPEGKEDNEQ